MRQQVGLVAHRLGRQRLDDMAVVDDINAVGKRQRRRDILLYDQDGLARFGKRPAGGEQIAHDDRRQPLERLVEQQDFRLADQRTRDRQHLLFAARQVGAAAAAPFLQPREHGVDAIERPAVRRRQAGEDEILLDVEAAEDASILVDQLHAG